MKTGITDKRKLRGKLGHGFEETNLAQKTRYRGHSTEDTVQNTDRMAHFVNTCKTRGGIDDHAYHIGIDYI